MNVSYTRGVCAALLAGLMLLTADALPGQAESGVARRGERPPSRAQRPEAPTGVPYAVLHFHDGRLSVQLRNAPWDEVLNALERQAGLRIQVTGHLTGTVSLEFAALPLEQGLRRLFRDAHALQVHPPAPQAGGTPQRVIRVWIFAQAGATDPHEEEAQRERAPATDEAQDERLTALHAFRQQGHIEALQQAIFDPDQTIQATALTLLAEQDRQAALDVLVDATRSEEPTRRLHALAFLHQTDQASEQTVLLALGEALADQDVAVQSYAIHALVERGGPDALAALRQALRDPDVSMKKLLIESVARTGQGQALLQEALADADATIRALAAFWLEEAAVKEK